MGVNTRISTHSYLWLSTRPWMMAGKKQRPRRIAIIEPDYCTGCRACVEVCPVDCIYEGDDQFYIHPDECIDCGACEPECPVTAIFPDTDVPPEWTDYIEKNANWDYP